MASPPRRIRSGAGRPRRPWAERGHAARAALIPLLWLLLLAAAPVRGAVGLSRADAPQVAGLYVVQAGGMMAVHGTLERVFTPAVLEHLQAGLPVTVRIRFEVWRQLTRWPDRRIAARTVQRTATYDRLRREYVLSEEGPSGTASRAVASLAELRAGMQVIAGEPVLPWDRLDAGRFYYVRVQARVKTEKPAFPFNRMLFFVPQGWILSDWAYSGNLTRAPAP